MKINLGPVAEGESPKAYIHRTAQAVPAPERHDWLLGTNWRHLGDTPKAKVYANLDLVDGVETFTQQAAVRLTLAMAARLRRVIHFDPKPGWWRMFQ